MARIGKKDIPKHIQAMEAQLNLLREMRVERMEFVNKNQQVIDHLTEQTALQREQVSQIESLISRVEKNFRELLELDEQMQKLSTDSPEERGDSFARAKMTAALAMTSPKNPKKEDVARAVREILEEAGTPVSRADLFRTLRERGMRIYGKDPEMVLSTMLWRVGEQFGIVNVKGEGYWLPSNGGFLSRHSIRDELG